MKSSAVETAAKIADVAAIAAAASLPWSTSATSVFVTIWLLSRPATLRFRDFIATLFKPYGAVPFLLLLFACLSMLWSDATIHDRFQALRPLVKLLAIPALISQFQEETKTGYRLINGYLISCSLLLGLALLSWCFPEVVSPLRLKAAGLPVRDYIAQGGEFTLCAFGLLYYLIWNPDRPTRVTLIAATGLASLFLLSAVFIDTSRTALITIFVLTVYTAIRLLGWMKGVAAGFLVSTLVILAALLISTSFQARILDIPRDLRQYVNTDVPTSGGLRLEYWRKSLEIIREAPIVGHGVGTTRSTFEEKSTGSKGLSSIVTDDPHSQILAIAITCGILGIALLFWMWLAHFELFAAAAVTPLLGSLVVMQNVTGSFFNSHLYGFTQGWTYVFGVGAIGGMVLRAKNRGAGIRTASDSPTST